MTNTGTSTVIGNVGVSPGTSITGFPPGVVTGGGFMRAMRSPPRPGGSRHGVRRPRGEPVDTSLSGQDLGGMTLTPGVYNFTGAAQLTGH